MISLLPNHLTGDTYEKLYDSELKYMSNLNLTEIKSYRQKLVARYNAINALLKHEPMSDAKRKYYLGYRKHVLRNLLSAAKKRIATLNRIINNGTNINTSHRFVRVAMEILPLDLFQRIYGLALSQIDLESMTIEDIKQFASDAKKLDH